MKPILFRWLIAGLTVCCLLGLAVWWFANRGSRLPTVRNVFGGYSDNQSVNGFGLLTQMLRRRGHHVTRTKFLTRQIEHANVLVWIHSGANLPDDQALEFLEGWMDRGGRVVFLGNDYDATLDYWRQVYRQSQGADRELARWVYRHQLRQELEFSPNPFGPMLRSGQRYAPGGHNRWMTVVGQEQPTIGLWRGTSEVEPWTQIPPEGGDDRRGGARATRQAVWVRTWLKPTGENARIVAHVEGNKDAIPVMWIEQTQRRSGRPGRDLWVISSPIFLNNFGILQPENNELREQLLDQLSPYQRVLFLETGPGPVLLSTTPDDRIDRPWAWMTQPPFPLFALHAMLLAVVFCFARYPVFGRAKRVEFRPRNDFGQHLAEVGRLLRSRKLESFARQKLAQYRQVTSRGLRRQTRSTPAAASPQKAPAAAEPESP